MKRNGEIDLYVDMSIRPDAPEFSIQDLGVKVYVHGAMLWNCLPTQAKQIQSLWELQKIDKVIYVTESDIE
jgi:hypothetical protein